MLQERDGTPQALRDLILRTVVPSMLGTERSRLLIARQHSHGDHGTLELHLYPEICFCLDGMAELYCGDQIERITTGHCIVIPPQVAHSAGGAHHITVPAAQASSRLLWMRSFPYGAVLNLCETRSGLHRSTMARVFLHRRIHTAVEQTIEELLGDAVGASQVAVCNLVQALTFVCRGSDVSVSEDIVAADPPALPAAAEETAAGRACRFMMEHFDSRLDLDAIARAAGTGKSQLCREFRRVYGTTVMEYLTRVRIDASKRLLQARMRVGDVAQFVGFDDPYHFSRVFKRITARSPKQFSDEA